MFNELTYKSFGNKAILVEWEAKINESILRDIVVAKGLIVNYYQDQLEDCIIGYNSITIIFLNNIIDFNATIESLATILKEKKVEQELVSTLWKIPVCYDESFGVDLEEISEIINTSKKDVIRKHIEAVYTVYFVGFLPGFLYLGGLDASLHIKRKSVPRLHVEKGAVAIGGAQTGIYPMDSAGGWNIIGKTPVPFFNINNENPCFAKSGDKIQFVSITLGEYKKIALEIELGLYHIVKESYSD